MYPVVLCSEENHVSTCHYLKHFKIVLQQLVLLYADYKYSSFQNAVYPLPTQSNRIDNSKLINIGIIDQLAIQLLSKKTN